MFLKSSVSLKQEIKYDKLYILSEFYVRYTGLIVHDEKGFDVYIIFNDKDINITKKEIL